MPQFDWLYNMCESVMSLTSGIHWVDLDFINNYKERQLLRFSLGRYIWYQSRLSNPV